jgi:uncharacterized membrane protein YphA (DoxX/SURF4 family)
MATTIWILKGVIAVVFAFTGTMKIFSPKAKLLDKGMKGLINLNETQIKVAGLLEVLGALGLILPSLLNIYPVLSTVSAFCLSLTMIAAGLINHKLKLSIIPNIVIFVICFLIAYLEKISQPLTTVIGIQ